MRPQTIIKTYKKGLSGWVRRSIGTWLMEKRGYTVTSIEEFKQYSGGKGCLLAIIFLPLALLGGTRYVRVTFSLKTV